MDEIYPSYQEADIVVLASPLYYWSISGQLKCAFDRLFAVAESNPNYRNPLKECILMMAAEGHGFSHVVEHYQQILQQLNWKDIGQVLAGGVNEIGDIIGNPVLEEARQLGAAII